MDEKGRCSRLALKALYDGELSENRRAEVLAHLQSCSKCRRDYEQIRRLSDFTSDALGASGQELSGSDKSSPVADVTPADVNRAFYRFVQATTSEGEPQEWRKLIAGQDDRTMAEQAPELNELHQTGTPDVRRANPVRLNTLAITSKRKRTIRRFSISAAAVAVCVGLFTTGIGNKAMAAMFQTFYTQQVVGLNPQDVQTVENRLQSALTNGQGNIQLNNYGEVKVSGGGRPSQLSLSQASQQVDYTIPQLPGTGGSRVEVTPSRQVILRLNVASVNKLLKELGAKQGFPLSVTDRPIVLNFPAQVEQRATKGKQTTSLLVSQVPSMQVPQGVDVNAIWATVLKMPFLPQDLKIQLASTHNWQNTAFVPFAKGTVNNVTVHGVNVVEHTEGSLRMALWIQNGKLYVLKGNLAAFPTTLSIQNRVAQVVG